ncbi:MAG: amidohydrolase [Armatimonadetes bacterium]|nr:amidohydrolase [Armatimonadota bacterium]
MIIDAHAHIGDRVGIWGRKRHAPDEHVRLLDASGIDKSVVFSVSSGLLAPQDFVAANDYVINGVREFPGRLIGFCMVNPMHGPAAIEEIRRTLDGHGLRGIKLHPPLHGFYFADSPFVYPVVEEAIRRDVPITFHTDFNSLCSSPYQVCGLARRYPEAKLILAHMGLDPQIMRELYPLVAEFKNVYLDTSATPDSPKTVIALPVERLGAGRLLMGSDAPGMDPRLAVMKVRLAGLSPVDEAAVLGGNVARLLKLG